MEEVRKIDSNSCREIYVILSKLGLFYKLPNELKDYISKNQNILHEYDFNRDLPLIYQIKNERTKAYISYLYLKYINNSNYEKNVLSKIYEKNEKAYKEEIMQKFNSNNIFKIKKSETIKNTTNVTEITEYKQSIIKKIINKIKIFFKIK